MAEDREAGEAKGAPFGFRTVGRDEHAALVGEVFDAVAGRYDLMNDLMSGGLHRLWKSAMLDWLAPRPGWTILDLAGGTGDVARGILERAAAEVVACDPSFAMLQAGVDRSIDSGVLEGISWVCARAEALPLASMSVDACTISFGLRNVTDRAGALAEIRRVLKPGGRFLCLEFSHPVLPLLAPLYDAYSFRVLPRLGALVTGHGEAYRYLVESIRAFPDREGLAAEIRAAGLGNVAVRSLAGGIVALHSAWRT